jgi:protein SCO1/2
MNVSAPTASARLPTLALLAVAFAAGLGLWLSQRTFSPSAPDTPTLAATSLFPQRSEVPPFSLDGADGKPMTADRLRGRWTLLFIGFTHCPDVCPTTLQTLAAAEKRWADLPVERRPQILFVSVDPERDTPTHTGEYVRFFSTDALAATADHPRLQSLVGSLGMVYAKQGDGENYAVDHFAGVMLLDPEVRRAGLIRPPMDAAAIAADLRVLAEREP